ncbi:MAG: hypothetical protein HQL17_01125 [Candidatus Omnitrophica bacterium]|nr:hypothetical protein [Candidatus Omnitrophota bacterium]
MAQSPIKLPLVPAPAVKQDDHSKGRQLYPVVCADCKKNCEIPFKPSADRPAYCNECFRQRKSVKLVNASAAQPLKAAVSVDTVVSACVDVPSTPVKEKRRPIPVKKSVPTRKPVPEKKKTSSRSK